MTGAVDRHGVWRAGGLGHFICGLRPVVKSRILAGNGDFRLIEQGAVDEGAGNGKLRLHTIDALVVGAATIPFQHIAEIVLPVLRIHVGRQVEIIAIEAAKIGDGCEIRAAAAGELHRQAFEKRLVGHDIRNDLDVRMLFFVTRQDVLQDFAAVAVIGAGEANFLCLSGTGKRCRPEGQGKRQAVFSAHLVSSL